MFTDEEIEEVLSIVKNGYTGEMADSLCFLLRSMFLMQNRDIAFYKKGFDKYCEELNKGF